MSVEVFLERLPRGSSKWGGKTQSHDSSTIQWAGGSDSTKTGRKKPIDAQIDSPCGYTYYGCPWTSNVNIFSLKCVVIPVCLSPGSLVDFSLRLGLCHWPPLNSITCIHKAIYLSIYLSIYLFIFHLFFFLNRSFAVITKYKPTLKIVWRYLWCIQSQNHDFCNAFRQVAKFERKICTYVLADVCGMCVCTIILPLKIFG